LILWLIVVVACDAIRESGSSLPGPRPPDIRRPHSADLLPLLQGDTDNRFDNIKQWLVNLDYKLKDSLARGNEHAAEELLISDFFYVLGELTSGISLAFDQVDANTNDVLVRTDDGVVSLDVLSQGTSSLMGWVGHLLQRQFDMSANVVSIRQQPAIVLVDEIDAHMHPLWQRLLVTQMKRLFPNIQFIVMTHSPLVAAGLSQEEIMIFRRQPDGISTGHPPIDTRGMRSDQILTSPLFDLDGTRDPEVDRYIARYTELSTQKDLSADEREELGRVSDVLKLRLPSHQEREEARTASALIEAAVQDRLSKMPPEERRKVVRELEAQVQEAITGSRRPA